MLVVLAFIN